MANRFNLDKNRYEEFSYLCYLDIEDPYVQNYVGFHLGHQKPVIVGRIKAHLEFWEKLRPPHGC